jgi:D-apionate oxidoisomerase
MATSIALLGAGGKMGCRITDNLKDRERYDVAYVEISDLGKANLAERGLAVTRLEDAIADAEIVVLAIPDRVIGAVTRSLVPKLKPGTMLVGLDPAAASANVMPVRGEISYFITHPCHPPLFNSDTDPEKMTDWFGGVHASQHVVCALYHGPEEDYAKGETLACDMYSNERCPVLGAHRVTVEQMTMLEPALVETFAATLGCAIKEMGEEAVARGVPRPAMEAFLSGHLRTIFAIVFGHAGFPFSDGAALAVKNAQSRIFQPGWKEKIMDPDNIRRSVAEITDSLGGES